MLLRRVRASDPRPVPLVPSSRWVVVFMAMKEGLCSPVIHSLPPHRLMKRILMCETDQRQHHQNETSTLAAITARRLELAAAHPTVVQNGTTRPSVITQLNKEAAALAAAHDHVGAAAAFTRVLDHSLALHVTHPQLYVVYCNRAASYLALRLYTQALSDCNACLALLRENGHRPSPQLGSTYVKALLRRGRAFMGLCRPLDAQAALLAALEADPSHLATKLALEDATRQLAGDQESGRSLQRRTLPSAWVAGAPRRLASGSGLTAASGCLGGSAQCSPKPAQGSSHAATPSHHLKGLTSSGHGLSHRASKGVISNKAVGDTTDLTDSTDSDSNSDSGAASGEEDQAAGSVQCGWEGEATAAAAGSAVVVAGSSLQQAAAGDGESDLSVVQDACGVAHLPGRLLTPRRAEVDQATRDTYNFVTIQTDMQMPRRLLACLGDTYRLSRMEAAVSHTVRNMCAWGERDCRVMLLGAGAGLLALAALRAGATHVTCVERWLYLAQSCREVLLRNGAPADRFSVVYKRPGDLLLRSDVPICANVLVCDMLDDALLTSGMVPAMRHAVASCLVTHDAVFVPCAATVYCQPVETVVRPVCGGLDLSALDRYRWTSSSVLPAPLAPDALRPLAAPLVAWRFEFCPAALAGGSALDGAHGGGLGSQEQTLDVCLEQGGMLNAVAFWFTLQLCEGVELSTGPDAVSAGLRSLQPALQHLAGQLRVAAGDVVPLLASHNTVSIAFDVEDAAYLHLLRPDAAVPPQLFAMAADERRLAAYDRAICRAIARMKAAGEEVHALDLGTGCGALALLAARGGADSVVAAEVHPVLVDVARRNTAMNGLGDKVSVVQCDVTQLQRGREVRHGGANLVVMDLVDAGLLGNGVLQMVRAVRARVATPDVTMVPAAATLWCCGVEVLSGCALGWDVSTLNKYRWDKEYEAVHLADLPHRRLTCPVRVFDVAFSADVDTPPPLAAAATLRLDVCAPGVVNAIAFWFDLHLDDEISITSAPDGVGVGGKLHGEGETEDEEGEGDGKRQEATRTAAAACTSASAGGSAFDSEAAQQAALRCTAEADGSAWKESKRAAASASGTPLPMAGHGAAGTRAGRHYWGQALQYLDNAEQVPPGGVLTVVARREAGGRVAFSLRPGRGMAVPRSPWKVEWGGGSSTENPHHQRAHYCELLITDWLQRLPSGRFPSIMKDLDAIQAHCGSLYLDPATLAAVRHRLALLECLFKEPHRCPAVLPAMVSRPPLSWC